MRIKGRNCERQFVVPSESGNGSYIVTHYADPPFDDEHHPEWSCSCLGWTRHFPRRKCKHILYAAAGGDTNFTDAIANILEGKG